MEWVLKKAGRDPNGLLREKGRSLLVTQVHLSVTVLGRNTTGTWKRDSGLQARRPSGVATPALVHHDTAWLMRSGSS
jgi:hypothetical protein